MPTRSQPVQARCRLGPRQCRLGAGSVPACHDASSVPARFGPRRCRHGPCSVPACANRSPPVKVPARCQLGPRQCRLGPRRCRLCYCQCLLGPRQCLLVAGSVSASLDAGSVPSGAGSALTCVGLVPVQFIFTQIKYHRLPTDHSALTPQNSDCIQAMPPFPPLSPLLSNPRPPSPSLETRASCYVKVSPQALSLGC